MKHVVSFSGGKDSTAMLLMMLERGMPIDDIVYFDCGDWEFPQMHEHIRQVEKYIGREVTRIRNKRGDLNYWMFDHASKPRGNNPVRVGMAWPQITVRWCTARKMDTIEAYYSRHKPELTVYIGFAADELSRLSSKNIIEKHWYQMQFPLVNWEITEEEALKYCHSKGFTWGGLYSYFNRVSCWCCPLQSLRELKQLYLHFPELWARLKDMDARAWNSFKPEWTVEELEKRFYFEEVQQGKLKMEGLK